VRSLKKASVEKNKAIEVLVSKNIFGIKNKKMTKKKPPNKCCLCKFNCLIILFNKINERIIEKKERQKFNKFMA